MALGAQITVWIALGLGTAVILAATISVLMFVFLAVFDGGEDEIADVQRFIELTDEARALVPPGLPLFDRNKGERMADAIDRFNAKKEEARAALSASHRARRMAHRLAPAPVPAARDEQPVLTLGSLVGD